MPKKQKIYLFVALLTGGLILFGDRLSWYLSRLRDGSDSPVYLLALLVLLGALCRDAAIELKADGLVLRKLWVCVGLIGALVYVILPEFTPNLVKSLLALITLLFLGFGFGLSRRPIWPYLGLAAVSLPVVASLQFFCGYPLRLVVAYGTRFLLMISGLQVTTEGVCLRVGDTLVAVDAPCSGVKMLWAGFFTTFLVAVLKRFGFWKTCLASVFTGLLLIIANVLRAYFLFFLESDLIPAPDFMHTMIGLMMYALTITVILVVLNRFKEKAVDQSVSFTLPARGFVCFAILLIWGLGIVQWVKNGPVTNAEVRPTMAITWPETWNDQPLEPLALTAKEAVFAQGFPGEIRKFRAGSDLLILRWMAQPSRKLHPAADCFKAMGFTVKPLPWVVLDEKERFGSFSAQKGAEKLLVKERIWSATGSQFEEVSAWYWHALLNPNEAPWWSVTVISN